ncbi:MAG: Unknown protein [uncultured Thiotrichaceae bacterium]|uniref:Glycosyltransferase 2-like domain-containing protein n=1 Tax=uncultured Thiotrichaceae bacterium TaxID=298394 RepID=A0A6S6S9P6_9GAMM|nr:MAG: Unknown protein [uncultured Thiotrichaceae bacterium]
MIERNCPVLLSIIIPVFNRQRSFDHLCQSLMHSIHLADASHYIEIIVVDDCSDIPVSLHYLPESTTHLLRNEKNCGAPASRLCGYQHAKGEFVHFHDSDDAFHEDWMSFVIELLDEDSSIDVLVTGRENIQADQHIFVYQKFVDDHSNNLARIHKRLVYRNCLGPLGGVTFSRRVLTNVSFTSLASCQDWLMYLEALPAAKKVVSCPYIVFYFSVSGADRISSQPRKKLLGHLQLTRFTMPMSLFGKPLRLYYLMTWKHFIKHRTMNHVQGFYKKNKIRMWFWYLLISIYWRIH